MGREMGMPAIPASQKVGEKELASNEKLLVPQEKKSDKKIHVVALRTGFFKQRRIKIGDKFTLDDESQFSKEWMKKI